MTAVACFPSLAHFLTPPLPQTVVKFFPHEASDLEPALALPRVSAASRGAAGEDPEGAGAGEVRHSRVLSPCGHVN